jgi:hypothetical protein
MQRAPSPAMRALITAALSLAAATAALADGFTTTISGYGTVGGSFTSDSDYAYRHDPSEFTGASSNLDIALDSRIGVQAVFDFGTEFSVTVQEVARERGDKTFSPGTEWFYAQYSPNSDWSLRIGRVALGTFLLSDSRLVGFAAPWFHAPNEVYGYEPFEYVDGGQVIWHKRLGVFGLILQSSFGTTEASEQAEATTLITTAHDVFNGSAALEYGNFLLRVAQTQFVYPVTLGLAPGYSLTYNVHDSFTSVGFQYDDGSALVLSEWTKRTENAAPLEMESLPILAGQAWYVAGGWRFGKLTPLLTVANSTPQKSLALPAGSFTSQSVTMRYDLAYHVALKAQVTRVPAGSFWYWVTSTPMATEHVNVFGLGADFVF